MNENINAGDERYIMYPRFIMMMMNDQFQDLPKNISRLTKGTDGRVKGMICKISKPTYVAPEMET
ncbi:hypothetical protein Hanom_Chr08g00737641 [Helianthus anomalus]